MSKNSGKTLKRLKKRKQFNSQKDSFSLSSKSHHTRLEMDSAKVEEETCDKMNSDCQPQPEAEPLSAGQRRKSERKINPEHSEVQRRKLRLKRAVWYMSILSCEIIGTGLLVFIGCSGAVPGIRPTPPSHVDICLVFGIAVFIIVLMFFHLSGGHINPAITMAAVVFKLIPPSLGVLYFLAQFTGAVLGYGTLLLTFPKETLYKSNMSMNHTHALCTTTPNPKVSTFQAFLAEYIATAVLIFVCCSIWDKRNTEKLGSAPLKIGLTVLVLAIALGPISGGGMNPARTFAPAVYTGTWDRQWLYWVGPLTSSLVTSYFYKIVYEGTPAPEPVTPDTS